MIDDDPINPDVPFVADPPVRPWRPSVIVRLIAVWQAVAGIVLAIAVLNAMAHGARISWAYELLTEAIIVAATAGGVALWRGEPPGFLMSCLVQLLQVVGVFTRSFAYILQLGPGILLTMPVLGNPMLRADLRATFTWYPSQPPESLGVGSIINVLAFAALAVLLVAHRRSGQPWIRWPAINIAWNRARLIGAYQVGAGVLGMVNATYAVDPAKGMNNLLFSIVVFASGVALFRRVRWSDGIAVAVNAVQVPVFSLGGWTVLLRSGVSCVVALASGASPGLHIQFDFGSIINDVLATGVDSYVGVNVVALGLLLLLIDDDTQTQPAAVDARRRFVIRKF